MHPPKSTQDLAEHIEAVVAEYIAEGRRAAQQAVERAFSSASTPARKSASPKMPTAKRTSGKRRPAAELAGLGEQLYELIRARPGESMATFAAELGVTVRALQRPALRLKRDGRIRRVGQRQHTRYFPTVAGKDRPSA